MIEDIGEGQRWGHVTYAQHGDDLFIINLFELMGIDKPSYLDIGANHPFAISNTALLYKRGSRGVNIEANPSLLHAFLNYRPEDTNVSIGIAPKQGSLEFFLFRDGNGLNTFSLSERDKTVASGNPVHSSVIIEVIPLSMAIERYCHGKWPNLLSIDVEGLDYDILSTTYIPYGYGPEIICVETRRHESQRMQAALYGHGYKLVARLAENLIFVRCDKYFAGY